MTPVVTAPTTDRSTLGIMVDFANRSLITLIPMVGTKRPCRLLSLGWRKPHVTLDVARKKSSFQTGMHLRYCPHDGVHAR